MYFLQTSLLSSYAGKPFLFKLTWRWNRSHVTSQVKWNFVNKQENVSLDHRFHKPWSHEQDRSRQSWRSSHLRPGYFWRPNHDVCSSAIRDMPCRWQFVPPCRQDDAIEVLGLYLSTGRNFKIYSLLTRLKVFPYFQIYLYISQCWTFIKILMKGQKRGKITVFTKSV